MKNWEKVQFKLFNDVLDLSNGELLLKSYLSDFGDLFSNLNGLETRDGDSIQLFKYVDYRLRFV